MEIKHRIKKIYKNFRDYYKHYSLTDLLFLPHNDSQSDLILAQPDHFIDNMHESHQEKVICYCRNEDDEYIRQVEVDLYTGAITSTILDNKLSSNPSFRRQAVSIQLQPESGERFFLNILQHKGNTYINTSDLKVKKK